MERKYEKKKSMTNLLANTLFDSYKSIQPSSLEETANFLRCIHNVRQSLCDAKITQLSFIERIVYKNFVGKFEEGIKKCTRMVNDYINERERMFGKFK